ncbi:SDR family NAD(P)-dependent oxidoreductase [Actinomadura graeca]|uniref:SDR family NAD(P)-dependent oxidoreductase n=1 Tax=Actinomadura graeca TaxID=2750812 RepID=A0ABX8QPK0_9ACTN|nr:type I polyketide synthase [Actinomadura graeca]QXJ20725.1 SDR family NAD(P)-dependent oxidoreductase [Actinomadura graeca]
MAADRAGGRDGTQRRRPGPGAAPGSRPGTEVIGVSPFGRPASRLAVAVARAGGLGVLDLGTDRAAALAALADVRRWWTGPFGVRVPAGCRVRPAELPDAAGTVLVDAPALRSDDSLDVAGFARGRRLLIEVVGPDEAAAVLPVAQGLAGAGNTGLIARGREAGGRVGETSTFVLLQHLAAGPAVDVPVYAAGGIGPHTAAAAVAGGAAGIVLDVQLALVREMDLPAAVVAALTAMDGSETAVVDGHRVYARPGLPGAGTAEPAAAGGLRVAGLPVGQDGPLAAALAARHKTAGGVVQAVRGEITEHIRAAVRAEPLAPAVAPSDAPRADDADDTDGVDADGVDGADGSSGAVPPVVQGPMTQVSDRPEFADAVARAGGLPFLALALKDGDKVRELLAATAGRLGGRPWGVGVLGFAPPEVREAQLAAVRAAAPPFAIVAGGRPAQAASLEAAGISAFLHVPSPELLERFLDEGARKFVFEGAECGGHVGPRASFPLWEAQVERLTAFGGDPAELSVMFAGGIHDARSAAMVAALAGPLAGRGAAVRVLMGTAYLFTAEAVEAGAILPGFQDAAIGCEGTALLETSPGHVTRCARTPYVVAFEEARRELAAVGMAPREVWRRLEELNLGRLRIASKGLRRRPSGEGPQPVEPAAQRTEGLFMMGQAAALRSAPTRLADLHEEVTAGATALLAARAAELGVAADRPPLPSAGPRPADIAIIGIGCVFPGAEDAGAYWANIARGVDSVTEVPAGRWDPDLYFGADGDGRTPSKWGGFIPDVPFDALAYGIPPAALGSVEPVQLLALEVASRALRDAGYADRPFDRSRTSVFFGAEGGGELAAAYAMRAALPSYLGEVPPGLDEQLPKPTEDSFPGVLTNVIAGRIANRLDLGGANYTVDAACAASLAALDAACKELVSGAGDMALCGGADLHNGIRDYLMFSSVRALSPSGRCAAFDASADGIALGEGVACVVLKRLADAERDGDRVYAVVKSVAGSSDGRSLGLTAPRSEGQRLALDRAYEGAGVPPSRVGLVEAHGTGTEVGDRAELETLAAVFAGAAPGSVALGSVKSQIGHTKCAAGLAGLIKTAHALHTGVLPGTLHLDRPNPAWDPAGPFSFGRTARPWAAAPGDRYAGISGFGFGGANFHAVLSGYGGAPEPVSGLADWPAELFLVRGEDRAAARAEVGRIRGVWDGRRGDRAGLRAAARACASGEGPVRVAFVATGPGDLDGKLDAAAAFLPGEGVFVASGEDGRDTAGTGTETGTGTDGPGAGQVAFLFPGQGSQRPGMLADLFVAFPRLQRLLRLAGGGHAPVMFPPAAFTAEESRRQRDALADTRAAQPALGIAGLAVHRLLTAVGVHPDLAAGHSYGELTALCAAGVFDETDLVELSTARAEAILSAAGPEPGAMAAVTGTLREVREALSGVSEIVIANHNAPRQVVVSGTAAGLERAAAVLAGHGLAAERLPVACAFHSPLVAPASAGLRAALAGRDLRSPAFPVWSNTTAAPYETDPADLADGLAGQLAAPVRFVEQIEAMYAAGARTFVEAGPGRVLTGLVGAILGDRPHTAVSCDVPGEDGLPRFLLALAELAAAGVPVDPLPLFAGRDAEADADAAPPASGWLVNGHLVRTADGGHPEGALRPARRVPGGTMSDRPRESEAAVLEYLRAGRELIAAQREVILRHLGPAAERPSRPPVQPRPPVPSVPFPRPVLKGEAVDAGPAPLPAPATVPDSEPEPDSEREHAPDVRASVLEVISSRTGYPRAMLKDDLDLEADLSIDSIKRTVITAELADRVGLTAGDAALERLARITTIGGIVAWLHDHLESPPAEVREPSSPAPPAGPARPADGSGTHVGTSALSGSGPAALPPRVQAPVLRQVVRTVPLKALPVPGEAGTTFAGERFLIVDDGCGIALELADMLERHGAQARTPLEVDGACDGLVHLAALRPGAAAVLPEAYAGIRGALTGGLRRLVVATGSGGDFGRRFGGGGVGDPAPGAGLRGLARTVAQEYPEVLVRAVDVDTKDTPRAIAQRILAEMLHPDAPVAVGHEGDVRRGLSVVPSELTGEPAVDLGPDGVVLLTGGARGITARVARALARMSGCHIELMGRTPEPDGEPSFPEAEDEAGLRRALVARGGRPPSEIEATIRRLLAEREVRRNLEALREDAASVRYHSGDVRDPQAVRDVVERVYLRHGRLDGVVHGAGLIEDRLVRDKGPGSFERVYRTKVDGACALAAAVRPDLGFFVVFGSVAGVHGNRGQADYAAANDACDTLARVWRTRLKGRVLVADWGPWAGGGMVSPELAREYARRGIGLIEPDAGVDALLREIAHGDETQVVFTGTVR